MRATRGLVLLVLIAGLALTACDESEAAPSARPATLAGTAWRVIAVNGRAPVPGSEPSAIFAATEVKGSAGCNSYGGRYSYDPGTGGIAFQDLAMTKMACLEPARNEIEELFSSVIIRATAASIDPQGRLVLSGPAGEIVLIVDAVPS